MTSNEAVLSPPWYRALSGSQWKTLIAANLGWTLDSFEFFALFLTVGFALHQLLDFTQSAAIPRYAGYIIATTLFGWATGGVIGGIVADYIGRKRTMILAIIAYSLTTGLSALSWNWEFSPFCGFSSELRSARSGRPAHRLLPNCGRTIHVEKAAASCNAALASVPSSLLAFGWPLAVSARRLGAGCI